MAKHSEPSPKRRKTTKPPSSHQQNLEIQVAKSPAEFFAENQAIAGFDNMGKSLYTTIRELVENSLDACESASILPDICIVIEDMTQAQFNELRGVGGNSKNMGEGAVDEGLFQKGAGGGKAASAAAVKKSAGSVKSKATPSVPADTTDVTKQTKGKPKKSGRKSEEAYFLISVRDNGCGMAHESIPNLLGRVLSGSKYGVRQTRGKFGLGAKMALIWSKKSTGVPIKIKTAHLKSKSNPPPVISKCILDIDIYKNEPKIIEHTKQPNKEGFVGTEVEVLIAGNWTTYKSRIVQYLQQLAIITPYAKLEMRYSNRTDCKKDVTIRYDRRSEQMPSPAREVNHHPSSVNNLIMQQLLEKSNSKTFLTFLTQDLSGISPSIAKRLIAELGSNNKKHNHFTESMPPSSINGTMTVELVQLLRNVKLFRAPDGSCLSPLGEYNLNLGIRKVIEPDIVATARDRASAHEGHPFLVEAAVSLGGKDAKEGISVLRFANRIPLLFEGGADVVTRVAQSKIKWSSYKIDHKRDRIGVFVSIVSTKIPFKGTGKEFISDEVTEIQQSVKRSLQSCCQQLRSHLSKRNALRDLHERRSRLVKYVPDVTRSLIGILDTMRERRMPKTADDDSNSDDDSIEIGDVSSTGTNTSLSSKRTREEVDIANIKLAKQRRQRDLMEKQVTVLLEKVDAEVLTEESLSVNLVDAIEKQSRMADGNDYMSTAGHMDRSGDGVECGRRGGKDSASNREIPQPVYLTPMYNLDDRVVDIIHPLFIFRPLRPINL